MYNLIVAEDDVSGVPQRFLWPFLVDASSAIRASTRANVKVFEPYGVRRLGLRGVDLFGFGVVMSPHVQPNSGWSGSAAMGQTVPWCGSRIYKLIIRPNAFPSFGQAVADVSECKHSLTHVALAAGVIEAHKDVGVKRR